MKAWFQIISELLVNLAAVWIASVFIDPKVYSDPIESLYSLTTRTMLAILSLGFAKKLRDEINKL